MSQDKTQLRRVLRNRRRALADQEQCSHRTALAQRFIRCRFLLRYQRIAIYLSNDGELDPSLLAARAWDTGKKLFLPVLRGDSKQALWFAAYHSGDQLLRNRFGIYEPKLTSHAPVPPWSIDLMLLPLVGFDTKGNRLGMGGGFYDRTLAYLNQRSVWRKPMLLGVAHECQKLTNIEVQSWDVPLDGIITEQNFYLKKQEN